MSATWTSDPLTISPTWFLTPTDEKFGEMSKGTSVNLYVITFVCVIFVLLTILIVVFAERRRRQAQEALGMMLRHASECDVVLREKRPVMRGVRSLGVGVGWRDVWPLAVHAILPIAHTEKHSSLTSKPPSEPQTPPRSRAWFSPRFLWSIDTLPTNSSLHTYDPYGPPTAAPPEVKECHPWLAQAADRATQEGYIRKAEAFEVTVLIEMPSLSRSRAGSRRSSGMSVGDSDVVKWGRQDDVEAQCDGPRTIPPFALGVARVDQR